MADITGRRLALLVDVSPTMRPHLEGVKHGIAQAMEKVLAKGDGSRQFGLVTCGSAPAVYGIEPEPATALGVAVEFHMQRPSLILRDRVMKLRLGNAQPDYLSGIWETLEIFRKESANGSQHSRTVCLVSDLRSGLPDDGKSMGPLAAAMKKAMVNMVVCIVPTPHLGDEAKRVFETNVEILERWCKLMNEPAADGSIVPAWRRSSITTDSFSMTNRESNAWNLRAALTSSD